MNSCSGASAEAISLSLSAASDGSPSAESDDAESVAGALSTGGYQLEDDSGKIVVISNQGVPSKGAKVAVSGRVMEGITVMGRSFGTAIQEHDHRSR